MNKSTWDSTVKPVVVLSVIALVVSFLLALVNSFTAPIIDANQKAATLAAYVDVMPTVSDAKTLEEVTGYTTENVTGVVKAEDGSIAIKAEEKGFDGGILSVIILTPLVAQGLPTVRHALAGVIIQPPGDVLRHVLAVELIHIHHVPQCETPGGCIVKIFLGVEHLHAAVFQFGLVDHCLKHIAANAV